MTAGSCPCHAATAVGDSPASSATDTDGCRTSAEVRALAAAAEVDKTVAAGEPLPSALAGNWLGMDLVGPEPDYVGLAQALGRHEKTVECHVTEILRRLEARNMIDAIRIATKLKLIL